MYIFIDPGEATGWAKFSDDGDMAGAGTCHGFEDACRWININIHSSQPVKRVIVEEFKLYPWKSTAQAWSEFFTVEVIGAIRAKCFELSIPFEKVPARNKNMGFTYMGTTEPSHSNPSNHQMVAMAHGVFWLQTHGIRKPQQGRYAND